MLSGEFSKYPVLNAPYFGLYCTWSGVQNIAENYTDVTVNVYVSYYNVEFGERSGTVSAGGASLDFSYSGLKHYNNAWTKRLMTTQTLRVYHDEDGFKNGCEISVSFNFNLTMSGVSLKSVTASTTVDLDPIPRVSIPTLTSDSWADDTAVMGDGVLTIHTNRKSDGFTHKISYVFGSESGVIAEAVGDFVEWYPQISLASQIPAAWSGIGSIVCETFSGGASVGSRSIPFTLIVPDDDRTKPSVRLTMTEGIDLFEGEYLQGVSKVSASYNIEIPYSNSNGLDVSLFDENGTWIAGLAGDWSSAKSGVIPAFGKITVRATITNARGQQGMDSEEIYVDPYSLPSLTASCERALESGVSKRTGEWLKVVARGDYSSLEGKNDCTLWYRIKKYDGTAFSETDRKIDLSSGEEVVRGFSDVVCEANKRNAFTVEVGITDTVGKSDTKIFYLKTADVSFHIKRGGRGASFGKYAEEDDLLDVSWNLKTHGTLLAAHIGDLGLYDGKNFDDLKGVTGYYVGDSSPEAVGCSQYPINQTGILIAFAAGEGFTYQAYWTFTDAIYTRAYYVENGWTLWKQR